MSENLFTHHMAYPANTLIVALLGVLLFTACSSEAPNGNAPSAMPTLPPASTAAPADAGFNDGSNTTVRLNPPHGEPGHVCEIPVGEPLDGAAGTGGAGASQTITMGSGTTPQPITMPQMQSTPSASGGAGRPNPAHGEPGHICEIPVGDPLP